MRPDKALWRWFLFWILAGLSLVGCARRERGSPVPSPFPTAQIAATYSSPGSPTASPSPQTPTETPVPVAVLVAPPQVDPFWRVGALAALQALAAS